MATNRMTFATRATCTAVGVETPASSVVEQMCQLNVHRLFVVDGNGVLVGVISALDVLRQLRS